MQIPLAYIDSAVLEEVPVSLWTELFEAVGWPESLAAKRTTFTHDDVLGAIQRDVLSDELLLALETVHNLGTPEGREAISAVMADRHVPLDALAQGGGERELALRLFLGQRKDGPLAEVFSRAQLQIQEGEHRRFNDFVGKKAATVRDVPAKGKALEAAVREFCKQSDLGDHVHVRVFDDDGGTFRFQIMRSHHTRTPLAVMPGSAGRATIKYRPVHSDLVRYEASVGRLRITARAASMVEFYRKTFGRVLFKDDTFFYGDPVCSLRVLQEQGRSALQRHRVFGVGRVWMTDCLWERGDGQRVTIHAADCFDTIDELGLNLTEGELLQAKLRIEVTGKSVRPLIVDVRAPSRIEVSQVLHEGLVNDVLEAIGIRNARANTPELDLWSLYPWRQPIRTWRVVLGGAETDALVKAGVLNKIQLDGVQAAAHPGAGRVLQAEPVSAGEFYGISQAPEIASQSLSATNLDGLALDMHAFQTHLRKLLGISGNVEKPSDDGLLDLGVLDVGDYRFRLTYALRQPPPDSAAVVNARASAGTRAVMLLPTTGDEVPGVPTVILDRPLPAKNALVRGIATKLNLTEQLPAILTAPEKARLIVDTQRGKIWFDGIEVTDLKPDTHQFKFAELLARKAPAAVLKEELAKHLSYGSKDGDQTARSAKTKTKKAIQDAVQGKGLTFEDPFRSENGSYRLTVLGHVI
jgi:hypothetical protein